MTEPLPDNQAHVVITPDGQILRYPRLSMAKAMWLDQNVVFTCERHLMERCSLHALNFYHRKLTGRDPGWVSKEVAARELWPIITRKASPHNPFARRGEYRGGKHVVKERQRLMFAASEYFDEYSPRIPPQAYVLGRYLAEHEPPGGYTWDGVTQTVREAHDRNVLRTRQDPMRIFNYYIDKLMDTGLLAIIDVETGEQVDRVRNEKHESAIVRTPVTRTQDSPMVGKLRGRTLDDRKNRL